MKGISNHMMENKNIKLIWILQFHKKKLYFNMGKVVDWSACPSKIQKLLKPMRDK